MNHRQFFQFHFLFLDVELEKKNVLLKDYQRLQKEYEQETSKLSQLQKEKKNLEIEIDSLKQQLNNQKEETEKLKVNCYSEAFLLSIYFSFC